MADRPAPGETPEPTMGGRHKALRALASRKLAVLDSLLGVRGVSRAELAHANDAAFCAVDALTNAVLSDIRKAAKEGRSHV